MEHIRGCSFKLSSATDTLELDEVQALVPHAFDLLQVLGLVSESRLLTRSFAFESVGYPFDPVASHNVDMRLLCDAQGLFYFLFFGSGTASAVI